MSRVGLPLVFVAVGCLCGCFSFSAMSRAIPFPRSKSKDVALEPDTVFMDIAPITVPLGDHRVNEDIWTAIDEQVIPSRQRRLLQHNGFRVGLATGGSAPAELRQLLTNKKTNPQPYQARRRVGNPAVVTLAKEVPKWDFGMRFEDRTETREFRRVVGQLAVVPLLENETAVHLQCIPQVEFDDPEKWSRINPRLALAVQGQRSTETFDFLKFDIILGENDFLVIGCRLDAVDSLAARLFLTPDPDWPVQRLLAIRAGSPKKKTALPNPSATASLAAQAAAP